MSPAKGTAGNKARTGKTYKLTGYTSLDIEAQEEMFEHDW